MVLLHSAFASALFVTGKLFSCDTKPRLPITALSPNNGQQNHLAGRKLSKFLLVLAPCPQQASVATFQKFVNRNAKFQ